MTASTAALLACLASAACSNSTQVLVANTPPAAAPRPTAVPNPPITKGAESGKKQILGSASSTLPDCTSDGYPTVTVVKKPQNGQMQIEKSDTYPSFPKDNVRYSCNSQKVPSVTFYYTSTAGFIGTDSVALELLFPDGNIRTYNFNILVR
jgi:hypothetical protein